MTERMSRPGGENTEAASYPGKDEPGVADYVGQAGAALSTDPVAREGARVLLARFK